MRPLAGLRVVELAGIGPGPFAAMHLADLGADVVRVDRPGPVSPITGDPRLNLLNRGKRSVAVDLKHARGAEVVLALAERADVLIEGWRPGVAERLGVGPEHVWAHNPKLVYGRMTGWGQEGPLSHSAGHDITYIGVAGALHPIGRAGGPPQVPVNLVGDFGGGSLYLVVGILAALRQAEMTGRGQVVDAAIVDGAAHLTTMVHSLLAGGRWSPNRGANLLDTGAPFYDVYETSDGGHMAVGALEPQFFAELVRLLGLDGPDFPTQYDLPRWPEMRERFAAVFASRTRDEWAKVFNGTDACVGPVLSVTEAPRDPHLVARGTYEERDGVVQPAPAPRFVQQKNATTATDPELSVTERGDGEHLPPPYPGEHSRAALEAWGVEGVESWLAEGAVIE